MPKLLFVVTEDWFFASHFLPMARVGVELGLEVVVVARVRDHAGVIEATGARVVALEAERRSVNPLHATATVRKLAAILRRERPDIVHCISLKPILIGGLASRLAGVKRQVFALTGLGFLGARQDKAAQGLRRMLRLVVRAGLQRAGTHYLFENRDDPRLLGLDPDAPDVTVVNGAGIDPERYRETPLPDGPTLRLALVARLLWSKGVDTAVEAVRLARSRGVDATLDLYGAPDPSNPKAVPLGTLDAWTREDGVRWHGATRDVAAVWRAHDVAILPSRGGEGLPRTLLESAASGRAMLTTDVPGCRDLVRDGVDGYVLPVGDADGFARRIGELAADRALLHKMGASAARRVREGYTERDVMDAVAALYRRMLAR
ncbi:glycosyltransferase family 4 protein [Aureimonas ureilytica]|uniref:glycosyltransferase family 4 protein n=1 Tax=Aureimonas ureilytica TaxID=401562 RepID=UPI003CE82A9E